MGSEPFVFRIVIIIDAMPVGNGGDDFTEFFFKFHSDLFVVIIGIRGSDQYWGDAVCLAEIQNVVEVGDAFRQEVFLFVAHMPIIAAAGFLPEFGRCGSDGLCLCLLGIGVAGLCLCLPGIGDAGLCLCLWGIGIAGLCIFVGGGKRRLCSFCISGGCLHRSASGGEGAQGEGGEKLGYVLAGGEYGEPVGDKVYIRTVVRNIFRGEEGVIFCAEEFLFRFVCHFVIERKVGNGNEHYAVFGKVISVHGQNGIIVVIGLAGHGKVEALVFFLKAVITECIFPMGTADVAKLYLAVGGGQIVEFVGIAVGIVHDLLILPVEQEKREYGTYGDNQTFCGEPDEVDKRNKSFHIFAVVRIESNKIPTRLLSLKITVWTVRTGRKPDSVSRLSGRKERRLHLFSARHSHKRQEAGWVWKCRPYGRNSYPGR